MPTLNEPIDEWLLRCRVLMNVDKMELLVTLLWSIWFGRNEGVFQRSFSVAAQTVTTARRHLEDYRAVALKKPVPLRRSGDGHWKASDVGWLKLNTDASCQQGIGVGLGGVLRN